MAQARKSAAKKKRKTRKGKSSPARRDLVIGDRLIPPGTLERIEIPVARLPTRNMVHLPVTVVRGRKPGPRVWINAALHGDEYNGVEIVRQVVEKINPARLSGTVVAVPIVNVFGFIIDSRYLPDGRDLNRSFPGSKNGSLAAQIAHLFMEEIVSACELGIDLHTGSRHRANHPQIRAVLDDPDTRRHAEVFGAPILLHSSLRDGSLRQAATKQGAKVLVYEAGESRRLDKEAIQVGVTGILRILASLGMRTPGPAPPRRKPVRIDKSRWLRARRTGILRWKADLGQTVKKGEILGYITDFLGDQATQVRAPEDGVVVGLSRDPVVNKGDGILHLGLLRSAGSSGSRNKGGSRRKQP